MSRSILTNRGIALIEVVIAVFLVAVGVLALLSMQPSAWRMTGKSDYMGRAAWILHKELERREAWIINPCNQVPPDGDRPLQVIWVSGNPASVGTGDAPYTVLTNIATKGVNSWTVRVTVTWPDQQAHGSRSLIETEGVTRQDRFSSPSGCINNSIALPVGF
jgi:Tfp pilus assembly protein PilV